MRWLCLILACCCFLLLLALPGYAYVGEQALIEKVDPEAGLDEDARSQLGSFQPSGNGDFGARLLELFRRAAADWNLFGWKDCMRTLGVVLAAAVFCQLLGSSEGMGRIASAGACLAVTVACVGDLRSMIGLGTQTVEKLHNYTRLLLPGLSFLMTASGNSGAAGTIYGAGVLFLDTLLAIISNLLVPLIYLHAALSAAEALLWKGGLGKLRDFLKWLVTAMLKWILFGCSAFLTATGLFAAAMDAQKVKAARFAISGMVPVVGGLVSDAAQTLLNAALSMKNAVGVYGMLAVFAICLHPFLRLWLHFMLMKLTAALCGLLDAGGVTGLLDKLTDSMGLIVGITGVCCILCLLILALFVMVVIP